MKWGDLMKKCSICGKEYEGKGNSAVPVNDGVCCDKCNMEIVVQRRKADIEYKAKQNLIRNK